jgi:5-methylcytosine-specific restriction endonuclease McrA
MRVQMRWRNSCRIEPPPPPQRGALVRLREERNRRSGGEAVVVTARAGHAGTTPTPAWRCACDCGTAAIVTGGNLRRGNTSSCGCFQREDSARRFTTHGLTGTKEYNAMVHALRRARALEAGGEFTAEDIRKLYALQRGRCIYCRKRLPIRKMQPDHIKPLARGGSNGPENIQLGCGPCNQRKHATDPFVFARKLGRLL